MRTCVLLELLTHQVIFFIVVAHKIILVRHVGFSDLRRLRLRNPRSIFSWRHDRFYSRWWVVALVFCLPFKHLLISASHVKLRFPLSIHAQSIHVLLTVLPIHWTTCWCWFLQANFLKGLPSYNETNFTKYHADSSCKLNVSVYII